MANTADLIGLQLEYVGAFADPEATPPVTALPELTEPDEEGRTGETEQSDDPSVLDELVARWDRKYPDGFVPEDSSEAMTHYDWCQFHLSQIEEDLKLMAIAADFLEKLADIAAMNNAASSKKYWDKSGGLPPRPLSHVVDEVSAPVFIDLPETHARQGTAECPGGLCSFD